MWEFPDDTVFADMLTYDGKAFEVRTRTKINGKWDYRTAWVSEESPAEYKGAPFKCIVCHQHAGGGQRVNHQGQPTGGIYGIRTRGADQTFSFPVLDEKRRGQWAAVDPALLESGLVEVVK